MTAGEMVALARQAQAGDSQARHVLLVELYAAVRKHVYLVTGTGPLADDVVQETMIALHRGLAGFRGDASPRTWALTIATRTAYRLRRREARYEAVNDSTIDVGVFDIAPIAAAELTLLRKALARLGAKKRDVFVLMAIFELSADEAARVLGTFANTAASRFRHARAELEAVLTRVDEPAAVRTTKLVES
jgi:RNA polymerase sigma-70 factor (ECF subfamily)